MLILNLNNMKKIITICMLGLATLGFSQEKQPTYLAEGNLVKATYYHEDGSIKTQGFFKDNKLNGEWVCFDKSGKKTQLAYYNEGKKVGKWFVWSEESLKEINYQDNAIVSVNIWKSDSKIDNRDK